MTDSDRFKDFMSYIREAEPQIKQVDDAWKRNEEYIRETLEKVHKLEMVSGYSIDSLISLFAAGWKLKAPELTLPVNWWTTEQVKEANRLRDEFLAKPIDIDVEKLEEMVRAINGGTNETR